MLYHIALGIPEMEALWKNYHTGVCEGTLSEEDTQIYRKWGKAMKLLAQNPRHPGLRTHEIKELSRR